MSVSHSPTGVVAYPDDLKRLNDLFDDMCRQRGFPRGSEAAEDLSRVVMNLFVQGVFDKADIRDSLDLYLGRKPSPAELSRALGNAQ